MDENLFKTLLKADEQFFVDYKQEFSSKVITGTKEEKQTAIGEIIKDVISISNSITSGNGYILYGVNQHTRTLSPVSEIIDDSKLQDQIKKYVSPTPRCTIGRLLCDNTPVGYCEIFTPEDFPSVVTRTIPGVFYEGQVWHRNSTKNTVCNFAELKQFFEPQYKRFETLSANHLESVATSYKSSGYIVTYQRYTDLDEKMLDGWQCAIFPGTRQRIGIGTDRNGSPDVVMLFRKPEI